MYTGDKLVLILWTAGWLALGVAAGGLVGELEHRDDKLALSVTQSELTNETAARKTLADMAISCYTRLGKKE